MNSRCEEYRSVMPDLLSGLLAEERLMDVRRHLNDCPGCREYFESLRCDDALLVAFTQAMQPMVRAVEDSVIQSVQRRSVKVVSSLPFGASLRRNWLKLAAAAVVALVVLGVMSRALGPFHVAAPSLAQTLETMQGRSWVHSVTTVESSKGITVHEDWECFGARIRASKRPDGFVRYANCGENVSYSYNPYSNKITIAFTTDNYMVPGWESPLAMISGIIESAQQSGATLSRGRAPGDNRRAELIRLSFTGNPHCESVTLIRDTERNLLVQMEQMALEGGERVRIATTFDYPEPGPANIYSLGVPASATVYDIRPEGPAMALVDQVQQRFERGFGDHLAVILESYVGEDGTLAPCEIAVLQQKGNLKRSDHYCAFNFRDPSRDPNTLYSQVKADWPNLTIPQVLQLENAGALERQMLFDGRRTLRRIRSLREGGLVADEHPTDQFKLPHSGPLVDSLTMLIWPNLHLELQSGSSQYKREVRLLPEDPNRPSLVGLRFVRFAETEDFWFDPDKDYMLTERVKSREGIGAVETYVVVQSERAASGRWYPAIMRTEFTTFALDAKARVTRYETRVLVDTSPAFDETTFAPAAATRPDDTAPDPNVAVPPVTEPPAPGMAGVVRDEQGETVAGATVVLFHKPMRWGLDDKILQTVVTDPNGRYVLTVPIHFKRTEPHDYAQDSYILFAVHPEYALAWQNIRQGQVKPTYELTLTRPTTRTIMVTDTAGNPIPGARVWLYEAGDRTDSNPLFRDYLFVKTDVGLVGGTTDGNGSVTVTNLPATECCFNASLKGFATGLAFSGQSRIRLTPGADVSGWVLTPAGAPVAGAIIRLQAQWMWRQFPARSDAQGRFEFTDLPAEGWDMSPWGRSEGGSGAYKIILEHAEHAASDTTLELLPGQVIDDLVIEVAAETTLVHCLVLEDGTDKPVPGARIAGDNKIGTINGYSDESGVFTVRVLPGPTSLWFDSPPNGVYILENTTSQGSTVRFEAQGAEMSVTVKSPPIAGRLTTVLGVVLRSDQEPLANVAVYAAAGRFETATAGNYVRPTGADASGRFELKEVPAGRDLHLLAETKDHKLAVTNVVHVPEDINDLPDIALVLQPTQNCAVVILGEDGNPAANTALSVEPMVEGERMWMSSAAREGRTDQLGILQMDGIIPGLTYHLCDARFDKVSGRLPEDSKTWLDCEMVLIPREQ